MRILLHGLSAFVAAFLCLTVLPTLGGQIPMPNLVLVGTGLAAFTNDRSVARTWALIGGLVLDLTLPGRPFYTLFFLSLVVIAAWVFDRLNARPTPVFMASAVLFSSACLVIIESLIGGQSWTLIWVVATVSNCVGFLLAYGITRLARPRSALLVEIG